MALESIIVGATRCVVLFYNIFNKSSVSRINERSITPITPMEIASRSNGAPEYSRKDIEKSFKGIKVQWKVKFNGIIDRKLFGTKGTVMLKYDNLGFYWVHLELYFVDFPEIKIAQKNDDFTVTGIITKVEHNTIALKPLKIEKNNFFVF